MVGWDFTKKFHYSQLFKNEKEEAIFLINKIHSKATVIGIVDFRYVELPLVLRFAAAGFSVLGFDIEATKVAMLNCAKSYI